MNPRYPFPDLNALPGDIRTRILAVQEKAGFIPNVFWRLHGARPSGARSSPTTMR